MSENAERAPDHLRRVVQGAALNLAGAGYEAIAGLALVAVITNAFDRATAGAVFATTALFLIAVSVVQMGTEVGLVKWLPTHISTGHRSNVRPTLAWAAGPVAVVATLAAVAGYLTAPALAGLAVAGGDEAAVTTYVRVLSLTLPIAAMYQTALAATRGLRTMRPTVFIEALGRNTAQLVAVAAIGAAGASGVGIILAWSLPYCGAFLAALAYLAFLLHRMAAGGATGPDGTATVADGAAPDASDSAVSFWRFTAPRALATITQVVLKRADIVLVAALVGPAAAAIYTAATRFVVLGQLGVQALQQSLAPNLSAMFARNRIDQAHDVFRATTAWTVLLSWPVYLACAALAPQLLALFGEGYPDGAVVVTILSLTMLFATASGSVDTVLLMSGRSWISLANAMVTVSVNLTLNIVLIPKIGIVGAAVSWAVAIVVRNVLALVQVKLNLGITPVGPDVIRAAATALTCYGPAVVLSLLTSAGGSTIILAVAAGTLLYPALIWMGRRQLRVSDLVGSLRGNREPRGRRADSVPSVRTADA